MGNTVSTRGRRGILCSVQIAQSRAFSSRVQKKAPSKYGKILQESRIYRGKRSAMSTVKGYPSPMANPLSVAGVTDDIRGHLKTPQAPTSAGHGQTDKEANSGVDSGGPKSGGHDSLVGPRLSVVAEHQSQDESGHHIFDREYFGGVVEALTNSVGRDGQADKSSNSGLEYGRAEFGEVDSLIGTHTSVGEYQNRDESGHHVFDEEYFGGIVDALTTSGGEGAGDIVEARELNPIDEQYFGAGTGESTEDGGDHPLAPASSDRTHQYTQTMLSRDPSVASQGNKANLFEEQYFGGEGSTAKDSDHPFRQGAGSADAPPWAHKNLENFGAGANENWGCPSDGVPILLPDSPCVAGGERNEENGAQAASDPGREEHQWSMDTGESESDVFWRGFLERETRKKLDIIEESHPPTAESHQVFAPAEVAQHLDTPTDHGGDEFMVSSLLRRGIELSEADRVKLESNREVLEHNARLQEVSNRTKTLELEVQGVYMEAHEEGKKRVPVRKPKTSQEVKLFGSPDPTVPVSEHGCTGCGALLHCQDVTQPGYLPSERFKSLAESGELHDAICQRCWHFVHYKQALNINLNAVDHEKIVSEIRTKRANVIVMVDLMDFPCSIVPDLRSMVGKQTPMFIVGNKFDLLPKDSPDYERRVARILLETCVREGVCNEEQAVGVQLVSARTGYGIEKLINILQRVWGARRDVYLLGTANIGKSTLFKTLLNSDFSKAKASYLIKEPTISPWPGTTLSLLKFPIMTPRPDKMAVRRARLKEEAARRAAEERGHRQKYERSRVKLSAYVEGKVGRSFSVPLRGQVQDETTDDTVPAGPFHDPFSTMHPDIRCNPRPLEPLKKKDLIEFRPIEFETGRWLYDTPGVLHDRQVLPHLTMAELKETLANRVLVPRTLVMRPGQVIFLGGLGRLDYVEGKKSIYFTVFASEALPVRYCAQEEADQFYQTHAGHRHLRVPIGGEERVRTFPKLLPTDLKITGVGWKESATDVLLSSAGWVAVTAGLQMEVHLRAFTPNGHGCFTRSPALLPFAINLKGKRPRKDKPFYVPDPKAVLRFR